MPLNIKNEEIHALAKTLATLTGESITQTVNIALKERYNRLCESKNNDYILSELRNIVQYCSNLPCKDTRGDDEIIGYDQYGLPK